MTSTALQKFNFLDRADEATSKEGRDPCFSAWICSLEGHHILCEVDYDYICDSFNLLGLSSYFRSSYNRALARILCNRPLSPGSSDSADAEETLRDAIFLYMFIHARFILTPSGLALMHEKYAQGHFGVCPRDYCNEARVIPTGSGEEYGVTRVVLYCPSCQECYASSYRIPCNSFGPSFAAVFFEAYSSWVPRQRPRPFVPKLFGFQIYARKSIIELKTKKGEYGLLAAKELKEEQENELDSKYDCFSDDRTSSE